MSLNKNICIYDFSDKSGVVVFNLITGETLALNALKSDIEDFFLTGYTRHDWDENVKNKLRGVAFKSISLINEKNSAF